jgi:enamine deaminase RidA (YjgF/YER057c/UK114 family)
MHSERRRISQGSDFERLVGYSRAVVDGRWVFVAGTTGFDYSDMTISDDIVEQVDQTLRNIDDALTRAGASAADVVRVRYMLPDADDFEACWPSLRRYFGDALPAATMTVVGLADPRMRIEIEVTARRDHPLRPQPETTPDANAASGPQRSEEDA